ncbi:translation initiation factor 2 [Lysinibacillus sp. NPDC097287]|uniref:translation initiation factor 2 n=1 Tax=Lysinibacillus sp. NPDC097287 TaxID=3364144 RepID=UPI00382A661C
MNDKKVNQSADSIDIQIAKLAYVGASISSLGGGIQLIAARLVIDALEKSNNKRSQNQDEQSKKLEDMQKQINSIIKELKQVKRMMR